MADENDLVSNVRITGTQESEALLEHYAQVGEQSFDRVNAAAARHAAAMASAGKAANAAGKDAAAGVDALNAKQIDPSKAKALADLEKGAFKLGNEVRKTVKDVAEFTARIAAMAAAGVAAGAGLLKLASSVAKSAGGSKDAIDKQTQAQIDSNNASLQATQGAIQYESAQRKLFSQLQSGQITNQQYQESLRNLRADYQEQIRVAAQLEQAQERVRLENERLQKQAADKKAFDALVDTWGGPMLTSLTALGNTVNNLFQQFKNAFGPSVASLLDVINNAITRNTGSINAFFDQASAKISTFVQQNGPAITKAIEGIGSVLGGIFNGIIEALPTMVIIFNTVLLPTLQAVGAALTSLANGFNFIANIINNVFGTNIPKVTGSVVALTAAFLFLSGGFKVIIGLLSVARVALGLLFGPFGGWIILIIALGAALIALAASVDWQALAAKAKIAIDSIIKFFTDLQTNVQLVWNTIKQMTADAWTAIVQTVTDLWNGLLDWFKAFPGNLNIIWETIKKAIVDAFNAAVEAVKKYFSDLKDSAMKYLQPIIDMLKSIINLGSSADSASSGGSPSFARGGQVRGRGTSTSDSIAAWLSNNEFVMRAKAVRKYGSAFMHAINRGDLDPSNILGFAAGGLVQSFTAPRVSLAGVSPGNSSGRVAPKILNLSIDGNDFDGLLVPDNVADRLEKYAVNRNTASAGRKASWVGGRR